jgi:hypothetical protein
MLIICRVCCMPLRIFETIACAIDDEFHFRSETRLTVRTHYRLVPVSLYIWSKGLLALVQVSVNCATPKVTTVF